MAGDEARAAVEFLQDLLVGKVVYDRLDPQHLRRLSEACQHVEQLAAVARFAPELPQRLAALARAEEGSDPEALEALRDALTQLAQRLEERALALARRAGELRRATQQEAASAGAPPWADPAARSFDGVVAVDLGTTHVVCAHWAYQGKEPTVDLLEPVAVNVIDARGFERLAEGSYLVGEAALAQRSAVNLYQSFRRALGTQNDTRPAVTGSNLVQVGVARLVAALIREALLRLTRRLGDQPLRFPQVVVAAPASGDLAFEYELRRVLDELGLEASTELDEATAAGVYYLLRPLLQRERGPDGTPRTPAELYAERFGLSAEQDGGLLALCVDFGGGATDLSLLELTLDQDEMACRVHVDVLGTAGFAELSGEGLTLHLFGLLKRRLALALAHPGRAVAGDPGAPAPVEHPLLAFHGAELGREDRYLAERLREELEALRARWDEVVGPEPLPEELALAVDHLVPTVTKDASKVGLKLRRETFRWLWSEAERIKRELSAERAEHLGPDGLPAADLVATARRRLDLARAPRHPQVGPARLLAEAGVDLERPGVPDALAVSARDVDWFVTHRGERRLDGAIAALRGERAVDRVLLAGNGARDARFAIVPYLCQRLDLAPERVHYHPEEAKPAVAKGACLWAVGNKLEGISVSISRKLRHPHALRLVSALRTEPLFEAGAPIDRFSYAQAAEREGSGEEQLIQVDRVVGGELQPFLIFNPLRDGRPLPDIADLPIMKRKDVLVIEVDRFLDVAFEGPRAAFSCKDPAQYLQMDEEWVTEWEMLERLRAAMSMEEAIAWLEGAEHLRRDPQPGKVVHRYYMDETRELYLLYHAPGRKLLCRGTVTEQAKRVLPEALDPFSGIH